LTEWTGETIIYYSDDPDFKSIFTEEIYLLSSQIFGEIKHSNELKSDYKGHA